MLIWAIVEFSLQWSINLQWKELIVQYIHTLVMQSTQSKPIVDQGMAVAVKSIVGSLALKIPLSVKCMYYKTLQI